MKHKPPEDLTREELVAALITPDGKGEEYKGLCLVTFVARTLDKALERLNT